MSKLITRLVILILVPGLVADPTLAYALERPRIFSRPWETAHTAPFFCQEAFANRAVQHWHAYCETLHARLNSREGAEGLGPSVKSEGPLAGLAADAITFIAQSGRLFSPGGKIFLPQGEWQPYTLLNKSVENIPDAKLSPRELRAWELLIESFHDRFRHYAMAGRGGTFRSSFRLFEAPEASTVAMIRFEDRTVFYVNRAFLAHLAEIQEVLNRQGFSHGIPAEWLGLDPSVFGLVDPVRCIVNAISSHEMEGHHPNRDRFDMTRTDRESELNIQGLRGDNRDGAMNAAAYRCYLRIAGISTVNLDEGVRRKGQDFEQEVRRLEVKLWPYLQPVVQNDVHLAIDYLMTTDPALAQRFSILLAPAGRANIRNIAQQMDKSFRDLLLGGGAVQAVQLLWFLIRKRPDWSELRDFEQACIRGETISRKGIEAFLRSVSLIEPMPLQYMRVRLNNFFEATDFHPKLRSLVGSLDPEDQRVAARFFKLLSSIERDFQLDWMPGDAVSPWTPILLEELMSGGYPWDASPVQRRFLQTVFERTLIDREEGPAIASQLHRGEFEIETARRIVRLCIAARTQYYMAREEGRDPASIAIESSRLPIGLIIALRQEGIKTFGDLVAHGGADVKVPDMIDALKPFLWGYLVGLGLIETPGIPVSVNRRGSRTTARRASSDYGFARSEGRPTEDHSPDPLPPSPKKALADLQLMEYVMLSGQGRPDLSAIIRRLEVLANSQARPLPPREVGTVLAWCLSIPWDAFEPGTGSAKYEAVQSAALLVLASYGWAPAFEPAWRLALGEKMPLATAASISHAFVLLATFSQARPFFMKQVSRLSAPNEFSDPQLREQVHQAVIKVLAGLPHAEDARLVESDTKAAAGASPLRERRTHASLYLWFGQLTETERHFITGFIRDVLRVHHRRVRDAPFVLTMGELRQYEVLLKNETAAQTLFMAWRADFLPAEMEPRRIWQAYQNRPTLMAINELVLAYARTRHADAEGLKTLGSLVEYLQRQLAEMYRRWTGRAIAVSVPAVIGKSALADDFTYPVPQEEAAAYIHGLRELFASGSPGREPGEIVWDRATGTVEVLGLSELASSLGTDYGGYSNKDGGQRAIFWAKLRNDAPAADLKGANLPPQFLLERTHWVQKLKHSSSPIQRFVYYLLAGVFGPLLETGVFNHLAQGLLPPVLIAGFGVLGLSGSPAEGITDFIVYMIAVPIFTLLHYRKGDKITPLEVLVRISLSGSFFVAYQHGGFLAPFAVHALWNIFSLTWNALLERRTPIHMLVMFLPGRAA